MKLKNKPKLEFTELLIFDIFELPLNNFEFIRSQKTENIIIENFTKNIDKIKEYYPNHYYDYLDEINFNKIITIVNHFLLYHNFKLYKKSTTYNKKKLYKYYITNIKEYKLSINKQNIVISLC